MYVKEKYRNKGYSKILNNAILKKAKELGYKKVYLKTDLNNYYEKFGARYIENLSNGEKLYCIDLENKIENNYYEKFGARYIENLSNGEKLYCIDLENKIENEISKCVFWSASWNKL